MKCLHHTVMWASHTKNMAESRCLVGAAVHNPQSEWLKYLVCPEHGCFCYLIIFCITLLNLYYILFDTNIKFNYHKNTDAAEGTRMGMFGH